MFRTTQKKWLGLGGLFVGILFLQAFISKQQTTNFYLPGVLATAASLGLVIGTSYAWLKKTKSWIYRGALVILLVPILALALTWEWLIIVFIRGYQF